MASRAQPVPVAADEHLIGGARYDYADAFEVRVEESDGRSAEELVRSALERASWQVRWTVWLTHRYVLRFRLGPRSSPDHVLGWKVATSEPEAFHLEAVSPFLRAAI